MRFANMLVSRLLQSPLHRLLSRSIDLVRYRGRRTGEQFTTPTQYAENDGELIILVGRPESKSWWRNFQQPRDIDVLVRGKWQPMVAEAIRGDLEANKLLDVYLARFPKAARNLRTESSRRGAVIVRCR